MQVPLKLLYSAATVLSLMAVQAPTMAQPVTSEHGTICKPYGDSNIGGLSSWFRGVSNNTGSDMWVICPIARPTEVAGGGFDVWISQAGAASTCWLYSNYYNGDLLGVAGPVFGPSWVSMGNGFVPDYSYQSIICLVPPGGNILGISPVL